MKSCRNWQASNLLWKEGRTERVELGDGKLRVSVVDARSSVTGR